MAKKITRSDERKSIFGLEVNGPVFFTSAIIIVISITLTILFEKKAQNFKATILSRIYRIGVSELESIIYENKDKVLAVINYFGARAQKS